MSDRQKIYWTIVNALGRFVGVCFFLGGMIFVVYGFSRGGALFIVSGLVVAVLGVLLICAKPYRSNHPNSNSENPKP